MRKAILIIVAVLVAGFVSYRIILPKIILANIISSFRNEAWRNEWIKNKIVLIEFDEKTAKALGGHGPEIFRKNLIKALKIIDDVISPDAVMIDAGFETETPFDEKLQKQFDKMAHYTVWAHSEKNNAFRRRSDVLYNLGARTNLSLGHIEVAYSTVDGKKLQLITPCMILNDKAVPSLALLAFELGFRRNSILSQDCGQWNGNYSDQSTWNSKELKVRFDYATLPTLTGKDGRKWMPIRYMDQEGFFKRISFIDVLASAKKGNATLEKFFKFKEEIKGKIVLIGVTVPEAGDRHVTEVGEMDGLEINANIIATFMRVFVEKNETVNK